MCLMKWIVLTQVIVLSIEAMPEDDRGVSFEDCGSLYDVVKLKVGSCPHAPCFMPLRRRVEISTEFEYMGYPTNDSLHHEVKWISNYVYTKARTTPDKCERSCLYETLTGYGFKADVFVSSTLPSVRGMMEWISYNAEGVRVVCFRVPVVFGTVDIRKRVVARAASLRFI